MSFDVMISNYFDMKESFEIKFAEIVRRQSAVDKKVVDILHEIELGSYDAATMMVVYKDLKDTLSKRRMIKDEVAKLQHFKQIFAHHKNITKTCVDVREKTYTPRILKLDFTNKKNLLKSRKELNIVPV